MEGQRSDSPGHSCMSLKSDWSMNPPLQFGGGSADLSLMEGQRSDSPGASDQSLMKGQRSPGPSCVSLKSDWSMNPPLQFGAGSADLSPMEGQRSDSPGPSVSLKSDWSMNPPLQFGAGSADLGHLNKEQQITNETPLKSIFKELKEKVMSLVNKELNGFEKLMSSDCTAEDEEDEEDTGSIIRHEVLKITQHILKKMEQMELADALQRKLELISAYQIKLRTNLRSRHQKINEGISQHGGSALLSEIYTELYITEGWGSEVNDQHEVRQIEAASRRPAAQERPITCNHLFRDGSIRTVLTKGIAGIGKTVSVQKFILDWAEGRANQNVLFVFPLPFRELNLMKHRNFSLMELLHHFFPEVKELLHLDCESHKVVLIFDGLDECRLPLNFQNNQNVVDMKEPASVDVLLTNLIKGNLLPSAHLWITTRPGAANQIPPGCVDQVTEVRGFSDPQKEEYFRKRISEENLAKQIISHIKSTRSLHIMCHIPVFCWISANVLERMLGEAHGGAIPKTLTQMFTHFLILQLKNKDQKYHGNLDHDPEKTRKTILALGKLAFRQLERGNLIFYEEDLRECGVDVREVSVCSGVCTQIFRREFGLYLEKVFSFVHLSVQEFLAALFAFICFINKNQGGEQSCEWPEMFKHPSLSEFLRNAVHVSLQSENGHLDLFLRFLLGLSLESNRTLLHGLLPQAGGSTSHATEEIVEYIKEKVRENSSPEKSINLFHCLNELEDDSLVQEVQAYLNRGGERVLSRSALSRSHWSAIVFVLLNSQQELDVFDLRRYDTSEQCFLNLLPVIKASRKAEVAGCNLSSESCGALSSVLSRSSCSLRDLDLSNNNLQDSGVKMLSAGLMDPDCNLEILRLDDCNVSSESCGALSSVLSRSSSSLRELDLRNNDLQDSGVKLLSAGLQDPGCNLVILRLCKCNLREESCGALGSIFSLNLSRLRELDLSFNNLQDSGVKVLSAGLETPRCNLDILRLDDCNVSSESCGALSSVLSRSSSSLRELDLSNNNLQDSGVKLLSAGLQDPGCNLEILRLSGCGVADEGCVALASALRSNPSSHLKELDLHSNKAGTSGVSLLFNLQNNSQCELKKILTDVQPTHHRELNVDYDHGEDDMDQYSEDDRDDRDDLDYDQHYEDDYIDHDQPDYEDHIQYDDADYEDHIQYDDADYDRDYVGDYMDDD